MATTPTPPKDVVSSLLSGEPQPIPPEEGTPATKKWRRDLLSYIRRLAGLLNGTNIVNTIIQQVGATTQLSVITGWKYDAATNKFQVQTSTITVLAFSTPSAWTNVAVGNQPVQVTQVVKTVNYSTASGVLSQDTVATVNVLSKGSDGSNHVDDSESCT